MSQSTLSRRVRRLAAGRPRSAQVLDRIGDPFDVLLGGDHHVAEHRRAGEPALRDMPKLCWSGLRARLGGQVPAVRAPLRPLLAGTRARPEFGVGQLNVLRDGSACVRVAAQLAAVIA
jgi:hypothetical protein